MRNTKIALAVLALVASTAAMADGATVYGHVDGGVAVKDTGAVNGKTTSFQGQGLEVPNFIGVTGSEEIEGGMKATYKVETGFNLGSGGQDNGSAGATSSSLFGRAANVGLSGEFGTVTAGLQTNAAFAAAASVEPRGMANTISALSVWGFNTSSTFTGIFDKNAIGYTTPSIGGFQASTTQSLGAKATSNEGQAAAYGATFVMGDVKTAAWQTSIYADAANAKSLVNTGAGAGYAMGPANINLYYNIKDVYNTGTGIISKSFSTYGLGGNYGVSEKVSVNLTYYTTKDTKTANTTVNTTALGANYTLSKRTSVYALYAMEKGGTASTVTNTTGTQDAGSILGAAAGKNGSLLGVGIKHAF